jgi:hypothetical protein
MTKKAASKAVAAAKKPKPAAKNPADKQRNISGKPGGESLEKQENNKGKPHRFRPGVSGNPRGRPPAGESLTGVLKAVMGEEGKRLAAEKLLDLALGKGRRKPYFPALKYLYDRTDGEPVKAIAAVVENAEIPVVLVREKQTMTEGEETHG